MDLGASAAGRNDRVVLVVGGGAELEPVVGELAVEFVQDDARFGDTCALQYFVQSMTSAVLVHWPPASNRTSPSNRPRSAFSRARVSSAVSDPRASITIGSPQRAPDVEGRSDALDGFPVIGAANVRPG